MVNGTLCDNGTHRGTLRGERNVERMRLAVLPLLVAGALASCHERPQPADAPKPPLQHVSMETPSGGNEGDDADPGGVVRAELFVMAQMHGPEEVDDDLRAVCAIHHYGANMKYLDFLVCRAKSYEDGNWEACTGAGTGFDAGVIEKCADGPEGRQLLEKSFAYSDNLGIYATPTWLVNGTHKFAGIDEATIKAHYCEYNAVPGCEPMAKPGASQPSQ